MKKYFLLITISLLLSSCSNTNSTDKDTYIKTSIKDAESVSCTFTKTTTLSFNGETIDNGSTTEESSPIILSFLDLNTSEPKLSAMGAQGSSYISNLNILSNTSNKMILSEVTPNEGNLFVYTIYKNDGVAVWTKNYSILDMPTSMISMGGCHIVKNINSEISKINLNKNNTENRLAMLIASSTTSQETGIQIPPQQQDIEKSWKTILKYSGKKSATSEIFNISGNKFKVIWIYSGTGNFVVQAVNPDNNILGGCPIANVIGDASAYTMCDKGPGPFYIHTEYANGPWTIEVQEYK